MPLTLGSSGLWLVFSIAPSSSRITQGSSTTVPSKPMINEVVREKCLKAWPDIRKEKGEADFDYHYSFVVFGCAGIIRAWVNRNCPESAEKMAEMAYGMILRGSLSGV